MYMNVPVIQSKQSTWEPLKPDEGGGHFPLNISYQKDESTSWRKDFPNIFWLEKLFRQSKSLGNNIWARVFILDVFEQSIFNLCNNIYFILKELKNG